MHEFGLCEGIVEAIQQRAAGRPVARMGVRMGVLHRVVAEPFQHAFAHAASGPEAEHAEVECPDALVVCPQCGGFDLALTSGDELILEWIEYQDPGASSR